MAPSSFWDFQEKVAAKSSLRAEAAAAGKPLTVSQLTSMIDAALRDGLPGTLSVRGEASNFKRHTASGHCYFTLKDAGACVDCVIFKTDGARLKFEPDNGLEMIATGRIGVYPQRGRYQLYVTALQPVGQGALELARQQIEAKLRAEGLFSAERKKEIPRYPRRIALVTSTQTAALQDMLKVLRRFPFLRLVACHVPVQGDGAAEKIAGALQHLTRAHGQIGGIDLILLGRGGGSLEDLWEFNEEVVARAIAACSIPVISGIGHEIDVCIADLAADYHAHTPTEAAQVAVQHWRSAADLLDESASRLKREASAFLQDSRRTVLNLERHELFRRPFDKVNQLRQVLDELAHRFGNSMARRTRAQRERLLRLESRLVERHPRGLIKLYEHRQRELCERLHRAMQHRMAERRSLIEGLSARLESISPQQVLRRGYSMTLTKKGVVVRSPSQVKPGDMLVTRLADGQIQSTVEDAQQLKLFE